LLSYLSNVNTKRADRLGAFLQQDGVATGNVASARASIGTMPFTNLCDPRPRWRMRLMGCSAASSADLEAEVPVDCVALISTTLGAGAMVQARLSNVANFGATLADTGLLNAETQDESQGNVVLVLQALVTARYLRVDLTDGAAQDTLWIARRSDSMAESGTAAPSGVP
jgi:hypothetical protein